MERHIPDPGFVGDTGASDPALAESLAAYARGDRTHADVLMTLQDCRLLVPVVAMLGEVEHDEHGLAHDKTTDMGAVLMRGVDGRLALVAFTSIEAMGRWDPDARPVPVAARLAATAAQQEDAGALVVDIAGPTTLVVQGEDLAALAAGWRLARVGEQAAWIGPSTP